MAFKTIKGLTVEIGGDTTELGKALENVNKKSKSLSGELGQINKLLKLDPGNTELLAQKQKVLAEAVDNTKDKLDTLKEAERQVQKQFEKGEASEEQVRALQREIIDTTKRVENYEKAVKETAEQLEKLGKEADDAATDVKDEGDAAKAAERDNESLGETLAETAKTGFAALAAAAAGAVTAIVATAEASREYRTAMGKLNTAFETSGHSAEVAYETYAELQGILGDTDQAVEAAGHLAKLADNEEDLAKWTKICTGVYATFGDSLPIENLAEASNETAKTGTLTGGLADALIWAGENEEEFQEALDKCTDEQERQALITKTLNRLYGDAATAYKVTNKAVIEANKANERWNKSLANIGGKMEPFVTSVKDLGAALLEEAADPLDTVVDWITKKFIPAVKNAANWIKNNLPIVKAVLAGLTAGFVTYKAATFAAELATKGYTIATIAAEVAQKALNLAMKMNPYVLLATLLATLIIGIATYATSVEETAKKVEVLTEEEKKLIEAAKETAGAFREQQAATEKNMNGLGSQYTHVKNLATELRNLAGASGEVAEKDRTRAQLILNELNTALGTEYTMTGNLITNYGDLTAQVNQLINSKLTNALLEAGNADYIAAIQAEQEALAAVNLAEKDYQAQMAATWQARDTYGALTREINEKLLNENYNYTESMRMYDTQRLLDAQDELEAQESLLAEKKAAYDTAATDYGNYSATISEYEAAQTAAMEGHYKQAQEILLGKTKNYADYSKGVSDATAAAVDALYKEAIDAGLAAEQTKTYFEQGIHGYTQEMVDEAEQAYEDALGAWADAYVDAEGVGEDLGGGVMGGLESTRSSLITKARTLVQNIISSMRDEADSHSPSRKMISFGEDMGEGVTIGLEHQTKPIIDTAQDQIARLVSAYSTPADLTGQSVYRGVSERQYSRQTAAYTATAQGYGGVLDKILAAIQAGQVLTIDGSALVGATADKLDSKLGQRRLLAARGAV